MISFLRRIYFKSLLLLVKFSGKVLGPLHGPWTHKLTTDYDVNQIEAKIRKGDVLLTRTRGEVTTILIPGSWKHAAIYIGNGYILEGASPRVRIRRLDGFIYKTDYIVLRRVKNLVDETANQIVNEARKFLDREYDFEMNTFDGKRMYCSEVVYHAFTKILGNVIELRNRCGFMTYTPDDIANHNSLYDTVYKTESVGK